MKEMDPESIETRIQDINTKLCTVELRPVLPLTIFEELAQNEFEAITPLATSRIGSLAREGNAMNWTTILTQEARDNCIVRTPTIWLANTSSLNVLYAMLCADMRHRVWSNAFLTKIYINHFNQQFSPSRDLVNVL